MNAQQEAVQVSLIQNGLLRQLVAIDGERVLRCAVCNIVDGHRADCSVKERLDAAGDVAVRR